jgi:hypothetical protein
MTDKVIQLNVPRINNILQYEDCKIDITYLNQGTNDERIDTITWSSVSYGRAPIKAKFSYIGSPGSYSLSSVQFTN